MNEYNEYNEIIRKYIENAKIWGESRFNDNAKLSNKYYEKMNNIIKAVKKNED